MHLCMPLLSPLVNVADLGPIVEMGRVSASPVEAPSHTDAASQTAAEYTLGSAGTVLVTLELKIIRSWCTNSKV